MAQCLTHRRCQKRPILFPLAWVSLPSSFFLPLCLRSDQQVTLAHPLLLVMLSGPLEWGPLDIIQWDCGTQDLDWSLLLPLPVFSQTIPAFIIHLSTMSWSFYQRALYMLFLLLHMISPTPSFSSLTPTSISGCLFFREVSLAFRLGQSSSPPPTGQGTFPSQVVTEHTFGWLFDWHISLLLDYKLLKDRNLICLHSCAPFAQWGARYTAVLNATLVGCLAECMVLAD